MRTWRFPTALKPIIAIGLLVVEFAWSNLIFLALVPVGLCALMHGALLGEFGVQELFLPKIDPATIAACKSADSFGACVSGLTLAAGGSSTFFAVAMCGVLCGVTALFWARECFKRNPSLEGRTLIWRAAIVVSTALCALAPVLVLPAPAVLATHTVAHAHIITVAQIYHVVLGVALASLIAGLWLIGGATKSLWTGVSVALALALGAFLVGVDGLLDGFSAVMTMITLIYIIARYIRFVPWPFYAALMCVVVVGIVFRATFWSSSGGVPYQISGLHADTKCSATTPAKQPMAEERLSPEEVLNARLGRSDSPRLVIVTASGGGYRATFWTAAVLDKLTVESREGGMIAGLDRSITLLTGASGGAVAQSYYAVLADKMTVDSVSPFTDRLVRDILSVQRSRNDGVIDTLTPLVAHLVRQDILDAAFPRDCGLDRGVVLDRSWPLINATTFADLLPLQRAGRAPALMLTPTVVETGEPLYVSSLRLDDQDSPRLDLFEYMPNAMAGMTVASAARLSATFPIVTPSAVLPATASGEGRGEDHPAIIHVVDAGYFDNQGSDAAAQFLVQDAVMDWLAARGGRVILINIRSQPDIVTQREASGHYDDLTTPIRTLVTAQRSQASLSTQRIWRLIADDYARRLGRDDAFVEIDFVNRLSDYVPMSWWIDADHRALLASQIGSAENRLALNRLRDAWSAATAPIIAPLPAQP